MLGQQRPEVSHQPKVPSLEDLAFRNLEHVKLDDFRSPAGHLFVLTDLAARFFGSLRGRVWLDFNIVAFVKTEAGYTWYQSQGEAWLNSSRGRSYLRYCKRKFIKTEQGAAWYLENDDA